ncbi:MAG: zinc-ribbon domain-containing protein [Myxococcota bacterium]
MDVGCPRCQTEYELDDARVPEDGVTVKCTTCGHIFRVKKKSLVVTLPVREGEAGAQQARPAGDLPPAPPSREWKIRQPGGNLFACRELTTLQKWIIEGKVGRDDEISLSGDTWKRLGNIPELASFFQVFEEAKKARALEALGNNTPLPSVPQPTPSAPRITDTWREPNFTSPAPEAAVAPPAPNIRETMRDPQFSVPPPPPPVTAPPQPAPLPPQAQPLPPQQPAPPPAPILQQPLPMAPANFRGPSDDELEKAVKGGSGKWLILVLLGLALGGGAGWYFGIYVPEQQRLEAERNKPPDTETPTEVTPPPPVPAVVDAGVEAVDAGAPEVDAGAVTPPVEVDAGAPEVDAGAPEVDAGAVAPKPEPKKSYEYFMSQGDRLREREKPEAALDMYGQAHDLKPTRAEPLAGRGLALLDMGNHLAATAAFQDALKYNARYGPAIMGLAEAYRLQGKNDQAVEYYQKYLDVLPNGVDAAVARNNIERLKK